ncbi:MAG: hypothetical protein FWG10_09395 [Eubacteriaceae bacterium]|nr:hypothetical protein [Eubacteriaceae bacterium]
MDGKARWIDNVVVGRWLRSLKVGHIHLAEYASPRELRQGIRNYANEYNFGRPCQSLKYKRPCQVYGAAFDVV